MVVYKGARAVIKSGAKLGTSQSYADAAARKSQDVRKSRESARSAQEEAQEVARVVAGSGLVGDDGVPPSIPVVTAEPFFHQVDLYWSRPARAESVVGSRVRIRPEGEGSRIVQRGADNASITNLPHKPHTFEVLLYDAWGRESLWSDAVTATPMLTAAEEIDLTEIAMAGRLRGILPELNIGTITDATKLADELINSGHIAPGAITGPKLPDSVITGVKIADGAVTGPKLPDSAITGPKVADGAVTGVKIAAGEVGATHISDGAVSTPKIAAGAVVADRIGANAVTTTKLDASSVVAEKVASGAIETTKLAVGAVDAGKIAAGAVTTPKLNAGAVTANEIATNAITSVKIAAGAVDANKMAANSINARELAADAILTRHITAGAVTASVMAAQDAAAFNLWAQNAMIRSAAIQSITADKIAAGTMTAGQIALAGGGSLKAGGVTLDSGGITMVGHGYMGDTGSVPGDLSIHPPADYAKMWFWYSPEFSGVSVRAEPIDSTVRAAAYIGAFPNKTANTNSPNTGCIEFYSGNSNNPAQVEINGRTEVYGDMYVDGAFSPTTRTDVTTIGANGDRKGFTHYQNTTMLQAHFQARVGTGQWRDISFLPELYIQYIDNEMIVVENNRGQAYDIRGWSWRVTFQ